MTTIILIIALISAITLGQSLLATLVLLPQVRNGSIYLPLALFFLANCLTELAFLAMLPTFAIVNQSLSGLAGFSALPLLCSLAPLFWIYVRALTSEKITVWSKRDIWHFALTILSLGPATIAWLLPTQEFLALFSPSDVSNPKSPTQNTLVLAVKVIDVLIIFQVGAYILLIMKRLKEYRTNMMQLFASTEHLELRWFNWLGAFMFAYLLLSINSYVAEELFQSLHSLELWEALIDFGLIATLAIWSLRQKPGLAIESRAIELETKQLQKDKDGSNKYQNSGLTGHARKNLADKIDAAMHDDKLYQSDELSLSMLAKHIGELPSYVTQTLNLEIGESFFEYVNRWRIEDAVQRLSQTDQTVLEIATNVGFNSRSSFYKSFKKNMGCTPSAYRKGLSHG